MRDKTRGRQYLFIFALLLFAYYMYGIRSIYGFELIPDEFGYWTYAATLSGCDWSDAVSTGSYYSYGYTLILYPIFQIFHNPVTAYRAAVTVNFLLVAAACLILTFLLGKMYGSRKPYYLLVCAIAVCYPSWLYYSRTTMAEVLIMFLYAAACLLAYLHFEQDRTWALAAFVAVLAYLYTVHMRTVGILIAAALTLAYRFFSRKRERKKVFAALLAGAALFAAANLVKDYAMTNIYTDRAQELVTWNDYSGQAGKVRALLTLTGLRDLIISVFCKVWYLGLASFGLFYRGLKLCVQQLVRGKKTFYLFVLLATAGEIAVTSVYTSGVGGRIDGLTYGRYNEQILPVLMALGCMEVLENHRSARKEVWLTLGMAAAHLPVLGLIIYVIDNYDMTNIHPTMILGISYLFDEETFEPMIYHVTAYIVAVILMMMVTALLRLFTKWKMTLLLVGIMVIELFLGMRLVHLFSEDTQMACYRDTQLVETIREEEADHDRLVYLQEDDRNYSVNLQFWLRDTALTFVYDAEDLSGDDLVVTDYLYSGMDDLKERYTTWRIMGHLAVFYNE